MAKITPKNRANNTVHGKRSIRIKRFYAAIFARSVISSHSSSKASFMYIMTFVPLPGTDSMSMRDSGP